MLHEIVASIPSFTPFSPSVVVEQEQDPRLLSALHFIDNNYSQASLGLKDISQSAGLSVWYFSRIFNTQMRMGFREYLKTLRMKHACKLLKSSPLSIKEISAAVGYTHLSDFYHHFKSEYGLSPRVFRRNAHVSRLLQEYFQSRQEKPGMPKQ
ncbi:MAG: helix-turn-helix domain-containing protein [Candidatus Angelobacter sp.]